jgi:hypothetical protein
MATHHKHTFPTLFWNQAQVMIVLNNRDADEWPHALGP